MFDHLLAPTRIGSLELRNRLVMAPMGVEMVGDDGHANDDIIAYYEERARGGVGLIITEVCAVAYPSGANSVHQLGLSDDSFVEDLRRLTDRIHDHGARIALQLVHHGKVSRVDVAEGRDVLVPSLPEWHGSYDMANDLAPDEIQMMMAASGGELRPQYKAMTTDDIALVTDQFPRQPPGEPVTPVSTAWRSTAPTATCCRGSCPVSGTAGTTRTAGRSRRGPASSAKC